MTTINVKFDKETIERNIVSLARAERVTKAKLSILSRTVLAYVYETKDVAMVTRLLTILTPVNKRVAVEYFTHFLGWSFNDEELTFGKKAKEKVYNKKFYAAAEFLSVETNDIWVWAEANIDVATKPKEYAKKITALVTRALKDEEEGISTKELLFAVLNSEGVSLADLIAPLEELKDSNK